MVVFLSKESFHFNDFRDRELTSCRPTRPGLSASRTARSPQLARLALQRGSEAGGCSKGPEDIEGVGRKPKANWRICAWSGGELADFTGPDGLINSCIQVCYLFFGIDTFFIQRSTASFFQLVCLQKGVQFCIQRV